MEESTIFYNEESDTYQLLGDEDEVLAEFDTITEAQEHLLFGY